VRTGSADKPPGGPPPRKKRPGRFHCSLIGFVAAASLYVGVSLALPLGAQAASPTPAATPAPTISPTSGTSAVPASPLPQKFSHRSLSTSPIVWIDGPVDSYWDPYWGTLDHAVASYTGAADGSYPNVGDVYYGRIAVYTDLYPAPPGTAGPPDVNIGVILPPNSALAIDAIHQVSCYRGTTDVTNDPAANCPQDPLFVDSGNFCLCWHYDFLTHSIPLATTFSVVFPLFSLTPLTAGNPADRLSAYTQSSHNTLLNHLKPSVGVQVGAHDPAAVLPFISNGAYGGYVTAAYIQNIGTVPAEITIRYFDQLGQLTGSGDSVILAVNANWTVRQDNGHSMSPGYAGSARVYSDSYDDQPLATFVNEFAPGNLGDATGYTGVKQPSGTGTTLYAPTIANGAYGGYRTGIGLMNAGTAPTTITVTYRDLNGTAVKAQVINGVPAYGYYGVFSGDTGQPSDAKLPEGFAGSATITSSGTPIAAVVNETGPGGQFSSYNAVPGGATTLQAPTALNNGFGGYFTGIGVQNTTATPGVVNVTYYNSDGLSFPHSFQIAANGYLGVYQGSLTDGPPANPNGYTAVLESTVPIAAIVVEVAPGSASGAQQSTSYNTFPGGVRTANLPLVESAGPDGWSTGLGIMNTGATTTVTVNYYDGDTGTPVGVAQTRSLAANAFWGVFQPTSGLPAGRRATATVTVSFGGQVAVICNESNTTSFMSYNGQ
jgi:hypothetical protein